MLKDFDLCDNFTIEANTPVEDDTRDDIFTTEPTSICDAKLIASNEVYQELVRYPDRYIDQLIGFTGTVLITSGKYIYADNPLFDSKTYTNGKFTDGARILENDEVIIFGWVTKERGIDVIVDAEAIYMLKDFDLCDDITTGDGTPADGLVQKTKITDLL